MDQYPHWGRGIGWRWRWGVGSRHTGEGDRLAGPVDCDTGTSYRFVGPAGRCTGIYSDPSGTGIGAGFVADNTTIGAWKGSHFSGRRRVG
ncbi:hypothetical protein KI387_014996, partial [Taxus chinensis]